MLRKDYLLNMIEDMGQVVAAVLGLKKQKKHKEALQQLNDLLRKQFRLHSKLLHSLSVEQIIDMFRFRGIVEVDKLQQVAYILQQEGEVYLDEKKEDEGYIRFMRALHLYLYCLLHGANRQLLHVADKIEYLITETKAYELPPNTKCLLALYYEQEGRYDVAENYWYSLEMKDKQFRDQVLAFYDRLLRLDASKLMEGGLPSEEVLEGRNTLLKQFT